MIRYLIPIKRTRHFVGQGHFEEADDGTISYVAWIIPKTSYSLLTKRHAIPIASSWLQLLKAAKSAGYIVGCPFPPRVNDWRRAPFDPACQSLVLRRNFEHLLSLERLRRKLARTSKINTVPMLLNEQQLSKADRLRIWEATRASVPHSTEKGTNDVL
jgi:hypothetical protein